MYRILGSLPWNALSLTWADLYAPAGFPDLVFQIDRVKFSSDFLVVEVPFPIILEADWLRRE